MATGGKAVTVCKLTALYHLKLKVERVWSYTSTTLHTSCSLFLAWFLINSATCTLSNSFINSKRLEKRYKLWTGTSIADNGIIQGLSNAHLSGYPRKRIFISGLVIKFCEKCNTVCTNSGKWVERRLLAF